MYVYVVTCASGMCMWIAGSVNMVVCVQTSLARMTKARHIGYHWPSSRMKCQRSGALQNRPFLRPQAVFPGSRTRQELNQGAGKPPDPEEEPKAESDFPFGSPL